MTKLHLASIPKITFRAASIALAFAALLALWAVATQPAQAQTFTVLASYNSPKSVRQANE